MIDRLLRRATGRTRRPERAPVLSFGSWDRLPDSSRGVVQVCHPDWRGVRTVAYSFRSPVVECDDLELWGADLVQRLKEEDVKLVVLQGWPPGAPGFVSSLVDAGLDVKCVLHSSPAQHGAEAHEALVVSEVLGLAGDGLLSDVGMAKPGSPEAFTALGYPVKYVPNRVPELPDMEKLDLGHGFHVGVFAEPFWRKNVVTQLLAVNLMEGATAHVMKRPDVGYLEDVEIVEHGELPWEDFVALQGSMDLNLYVSLSECHPSTPQESYLAGVPCLTSRVSGVFRDDAALWQLTTTDLLDNPLSIAEAAEDLHRSRDEAVRRALSWMEKADAEAVAIWADFISS